MKFVLWQHNDGRKWLLLNGRIVASGFSWMSMSDVIEAALTADGMGQKRIRRLNISEIVLSMPVIRVSHPQFYRPIEGRPREVHMKQFHYILLYNTSTLASFWPFLRTTDVLVQVASGSIGAESVTQALDCLFRQYNRVNEGDMAGLDFRSMSVGDVVRIVEVPEEQNSIDYYVCSCVGWDCISGVSASHLPLAICIPPAGMTVGQYHRTVCDNVRRGLRIPV